MTSFLQKLSAAILLGLVPVGLAAAPAKADVFDWTFTGPAASLGGPVATGGGTLTTGAAAGAGFLVTDITGTFGGNAITGLLPVGTIDSNDNLVFPTSTSFLDPSGLAFSAGGNDDLFGFYAPGSVVTPGNNYGEFASGSFGGVGTFALTPAAAVPEPASLMLLAGGLVALGVARRRRA